ncbi:uncharacterized protein LOC101241784 isoform X3 [Hydra vulgaris]|uniref:Uncharacterized protein LOC101241784 isoform X3 n=1 Tax=Hydra vulgaris TaxID=6087 RepID=A0ABM4BE26_HYDVU
MLVNIFAIIIGFLTSIEYIQALEIRETKIKFPAIEKIILSSAATEILPKLATGVLPMKEFRKLGCWKDTANRTLFELEERFSLLDGLPNLRLDSLTKCYEAAKVYGYKIFSLQNGGHCFGGNGISYQKYGKSNDCQPNGKGGLWANEVYTENDRSIKVEKIVEFRKLGCWKDTPIRALFDLEGKSQLLDGSPQQRLDPLIKCYKAAKANGYLIFALQYGGQCFAGNGLAYQKYGTSNACNVDGRGGAWSNAVYQEDFKYGNYSETLEFKKLGCWKDTPERTLVELEAKSSILDGSPQQRSGSLLKCYIAARERGFKIFSLQYGGQCFAGNGVSYQKFGKSNDCNQNGKGGTWANEVYTLNEQSLKEQVVVNFKKLGCWKDTPSRTLFELEGKSSLLDGSPQLRLDPLIKCYEAAKANGYSIFSLQYGGQCFAGNGTSYKKYGRSSKCNVDGRGGTWANEVYKKDFLFRINRRNLMFTNLGCWKDTPKRSLVELEGKSSILDGIPQQRADPLGKCYRAATERGFTVFSLQYGGQCFAGNGVSYKKFGKSTNCNADGRGGTWANEVYVFGVSKIVAAFLLLPQPY